MPFTEKTYNTDTILKLLDATTNYDTDAIIALQTIKNYSIDAILKKLGLIKSYPLDAAIQKTDIAENYSVDTLIEVGTRIKSYLTDVGIKNLDGTMKYALDVRIRMQDGEVYNIDVVLVRNMITSSYSLDFIIETVDKSTDYDIDMLICKANQTSAYAVDVLMADIPTVSQISNSGGTLQFKVLNINEKQRCIPAIRDVPTGTTVGQFLDTGTYILYPKTIEFKIRCDDDDKTTLDAIYAANEKVTIYFFTSLSYWKYIGWLHGKTYTFEWSTENDSSGDQNWLLTITVDVEIYSFTAVA
jgi:hypothetical protein